MSKEQKIEEKVEQKPRTLEELSILELKGVLYDLQSQMQQVANMIQKKTLEEQNG